MCHESHVLLILSLAVQRDRFCKLPRDTYHYNMIFLYTVSTILKFFIIYMFILVKILAGLPRTTRGKPIVIKTDPKGKNFLYCNGNSVFIRNASVSVQPFRDLRIKDVIVT